MRATTSSMLTTGVWARIGLRTLTAREYQLLRLPRRAAWSARMSSHLAPRKSLLSRHAKQRQSRGAGRQESGPRALGCAEREQLRPQGQLAGDEKGRADQPARDRVARPRQVQGRRAGAGDPQGLWHLRRAARRSRDRG